MLKLRTHDERLAPHPNALAGSCGDANPVGQLRVDVSDDRAVDGAVGAQAAVVFLVVVHAVDLE